MAKWMEEEAQWTWDCFYGDITIYKFGIVGFWADWMARRNETSDNCASCSLAHGLFALGRTGGLGFVRKRWRLTTNGRDCQLRMEALKGVGKVSKLALWCDDGWGMEVSSRDGQIWGFVQINLNPSSDCMEMRGMRNRFVRPCRIGWGWEKKVQKREV